MLAGPADEAYGDIVMDYIEDDIFRTMLAPTDVAGILVEPIQGCLLYTSRCV